MNVGLSATVPNQTALRLCLEGTAAGRRPIAETANE